MPPAVATPNLLTGPGFLWIAPVGTADPTHTSAGGKFTDTVPAAYLPLGATSEGTAFTYATEVEPIDVAEFLDPVRYETVSRTGSVAFALASNTLSNYRRALNGGVAALVATGTVGAEVTTFEPPNPGEEVRAKLLFETSDGSLRFIFRQVLQGGEVELAFRKAPEKALVPCTFNLEVPTGATKPFAIVAAGTARV